MASQRLDGLPPLPDPSHIHSFRAGIDVNHTPIVLLHGSGGDQFALMSLASELAPKATHIGIRGTVEIDGGYAFFHRFPDRRVNETDINARVPVLAKFIEATCAHHKCPRWPIAIGFSNGAIMAAALLLMNPGLLAGAILFRPLSPFTHDFPHQLNNTPVLIIDGEKDDRRSPGDGLRLAKRMVCAGASVTHHLLSVGHAISAEDKQLASEWLKNLVQNS